MAVGVWLKLALDISWAWIALSVIRGVYQPPGNYWVVVNRVMQVRHLLTSKGRTASNTPLGRLHRGRRPPSGENLPALRRDQLPPDRARGPSRGEPAGTEGARPPLERAARAQEDEQRPGHRARPQGEPELGQLPRAEAHVRGGVAGREGRRLARAEGEAWWAHDARREPRAAEEGARGDHRRPGRGHHRPGRAQKLALSQGERL
jgi:hypothetical protein